MEDLLRVGIITSTHGVIGEVKLFPTTDDPKRFKKYKDYILKNKNKTMNVTVESAKFFKNMVILKFKEFNSLNEVETLKQAELYVTRENAIPLNDGEYFICDIIGSKVVDEEDNEIGNITDVLETGANNVYEITTKEGKELLFPVIDECVKKVDIENKIVHVHVMKGLMDL